MPSGSELIAAERERQISDEGWSAKHDDAHEDSELVGAAVAYASFGAFKVKAKVGAPDTNCGCRSADECTHWMGEPKWRDPWPWDDGYWKPSDDRIRNLAKAGALIAAEIDRLQRKAE